MKKKRRFIDREKKYLVFADEFCNMSDTNRHKKAAKLASNNGKCWWVHDWMMAYPNCIRKQSKKSYENS